MVESLNETHIPVPVVCLSSVENALWKPTRLPGFHMSGFGEESECEPDEHSQEAEAHPEAGQRGHVLHVTLRPREVTNRPHVTRGRPILIRYLYFREAFIKKKGWHLSF